MAEWGRGSRICASIRDFQEALQITFDPVATDRENARQLCGLTQVCEYAIHFRTLATESGWNSTALYDAFLKGLAPPIYERVLPLDLPPDLDPLIALAIRTDNRLEEFKALQRERAPTNRLSQQQSALPWSSRPRSSPERSHRAIPTPDTEEPMQMGRAHLSPEDSAA